MGRLRAVINEAILGTEFDRSVALIQKIVREIYGHEMPDNALRGALMDDQRTVGRFPTPRECEQMMVSSREDDNWIVSKVGKRFPATCAELESTWELSKLADG